MDLCDLNGRTLLWAKESCTGDPKNLCAGLVPQKVTAFSVPSYIVRINGRCLGVADSF